MLHLKLADWMIGLHWLAGHPPTSCFCKQRSRFHVFAPMHCVLLTNHPRNAIRFLLSEQNLSLTPGAFHLKSPGAVRNNGATSQRPGYESALFRGLASPTDFSTVRPPCHSYGRASAAADPRTDPERRSAEKLRSLVSRNESGRTSGAKGGGIETQPPEWFTLSKNRR
jgi:hypothetical protein